MKKAFSLLLAAVLLASLPACRRTVRTQASGRGPAAPEVVDAMLPASGYTGQPGSLEYLNTETDGTGRLTVYLENAYGLADGAWEDAAVIRAAGASAFELAVLRLKNENESFLAAVLLESYLTGRKGDFAGYAPEQADMVEGAVIAREGAYAALCVCPEPDRAAETFRGLVKGSSLTGLLDILPSASPWLPQGGATAPGPQATQYAVSYPGRCDFIRPGIDDMSIYDTSAILDAWELGSPIFLSAYDRAIYNAAGQVLDEVVRDGMSDLEKETAVYYWIVNNVNYDWTHTDVMQETPRESFTPYGALVNRTAVCLGYAATFQLLMDMTGVECVTVVGADDSSRADHGWNMVRLNGNWYCVDPTWDANYREYYGYPWGLRDNWRFFNVTSDEMAASDHQWDYASVPEAVTRGNGRG